MPERVFDPTGGEILPPEFGIASNRALPDERDFRVRVCRDEPGMIRLRLTGSETAAVTGTGPARGCSEDIKRSTETIMSSRQERVHDRAKRIKEEEGASHGRDPENLDPEMLEGEDAETARANKAMKRDRDGSDETQTFKPGERLPPD